MWFGDNSRADLSTISGNLPIIFSSFVVCQSLGVLAFISILDFAAFFKTEFARAKEYWRYGPESPPKFKISSQLKTISLEDSLFRSLNFIAPMPTSSAISGLNFEARETASFKTSSSHITFPFLVLIFPSSNL